MFKNCLIIMHQPIMWKWFFFHFSLKHPAGSHVPSMEFSGYLYRTTGLLPQYSSSFVMQFSRFHCHIKWLILDVSSVLVPIFKFQFIIGSSLSFPVGLIVHRSQPYRRIDIRYQLSTICCLFLIAQVGRRKNHPWPYLRGYVTLRIKLYVCIM